jgi:tRNA dimethylallyltransferase
MSQALAVDPLDRLKKIGKQNQKKVIVIAGPTATGKTDLSIELAMKIRGEIVSADSMQVYKGLDIGTAKATLEQMSKVPHHLIDIREIVEPYNAAAYARDAYEAISHIMAENKVPIVVGGNGFYLQSLLYGPPEGPPSDPIIRKSLEDELEKFGVEMLFSKLKAFDPIYASTITLQDKHKIVRALEIITITHKKVSDFPKPTQKKPVDTFEFVCFFIYYPKPILYERIEKRCDIMLQEGLIDETIRMKELGLEQNSSAQTAIGYRQVLDYLKTEMTPKDYQNFVAEFKKASRNYAKRQFTWFRKQPLFEWIDLTQISHSQLIDKILSKL